MFKCLKRFLTLMPHCCALRGSSRCAPTRR
nr:MAG TPA: hypothetical protein [Caudoviricetes sp.]